MVALVLERRGNAGDLDVRKRERTLPVEESGISGPPQLAAKDRRKDYLPVLAGSWCEFDMQDQYSGPAHPRMKHEFSEIERAPYSARPRSAERKWHF